MIIHKLHRNFSRKEAKLVIQYMKEIIDGYGYVTLAEFYDLVDVISPLYTNRVKVWKSLTNARVSLFRVKGSYIIMLPDYEYLT